MVGGRLSCIWYRPPASARPPATGTLPEIVLSSSPLVSMLGECVTTAAEVLPAMVFPEGRLARRPGNCGGSGVTVNGVASGHNAKCGG